MTIARVPPAAAGDGDGCRGRGRAAGRRSSRGRRRGAAGASARHRGHLRRRAGQRGFLPPIPQSTRGGRLSWARAQPMAERSSAARPGHCQVGQPTRTAHGDQLAWLWLRHQPASALSRWFHMRVGGAKGRMRRIMLVAMARKLIVSLWRVVTDGTVPDGAALKFRRVRRGGCRTAGVGAGRTWTAQPSGFYAVKKMGPVFPASHSPMHVGMWSGIFRPTGYKAVRPSAAHRTARRPDPVRQFTSRTEEITLDKMSLIKGAVACCRRGRRRASGPADRALVHGRSQGRSERPHRASLVAARRAAARAVRPPFRLDLPLRRGPPGQRRRLCPRAARGLDGCNEHVPRSVCRNHRP